jgi:hypothetical protein
MNELSKEKRMGWFTRQSLSAARYHSHLFTPMDE